MGKKAKTKKSKHIHVKKPVELAQSDKWYKKNDKLLFVFALMLITFIAYTPVLNNEFISFDDNELIVRHELVAGGSDVSIKEIFTNKRYIYRPHYKPLVFLMWNLEYRIFGFNSTVYHLNNLILHLFNVLLVFLIVFRLSSNFNIDNDKKNLLSFFIALLFAIHPLHVESVGWATERKDVLYSFFYLSSILLYLKYTGDKYRVKWLIPSVILYGLAILSKSMGITLIAMLFIIDFVQKRKFNLQSFKDKIPYLIIFIVGLYLHGLLTDFGRHATGLSAGIVDKGFSDYPSNFDGLPSFYIRILILNIRFILWIAHIIVPIKISAVYPRAEILESLGVGIHIFPLITILLFVSAIYFRKKAAWFLFGLLFFTIALSPALAIAEKGISVFLSDRYTYISSIGIFIIAVVGFYHFASQQKIMKIFTPVLVIILLIFFVSTFRYVNVWETSETFWSNVIKVSKNNASVYNARGKVNRDKGNYEQALADYDKAIELDPAFYKAYHNRAKIYFDQQRFDEAIENYSVVLEFNPRFYEAVSNLGIIYASQQKNDLALEMLNRAMDIKPDHLNTIRSRGMLYEQMGEYDKALVDFIIYLKENPYDDGIYNSVGVIYQNLDLHQRAIPAFTSSINIKPSQGIYWQNRSISYYMLKDYDNALSDIEKAIELGIKVNPEYVNGLR